MTDDTPPLPYKVELIVVKVDGEQSYDEQFEIELNKVAAQFPAYRLDCIVSEEAGSNTRYPFLYYITTIWKWVNY